MREEHCGIQAYPGLYLQNQISIEHKRPHLDIPLSSFHLQVLIITSWLVTHAELKLSVPEINNNIPITTNIRQLRFMLSSLIFTLVPVYAS